MKTKSSLFIIAVLSAMLPLCRAQTTTSTQNTVVPQSTTPAIVSRAANSRVWQRTVYDLSQSGQVISQNHYYTELADGLCYQENGQWLDSQEQINIMPDGSAEATQGLHQAYFPANIYNGVITLVTPDGLQLKSQPVGLSYDDGTNIVLIAELTNSVGQLISSNQVIYTNAFVGIDADLLYTYSKGGFEQDVIFRQQPPVPEQFGLNSASTLLELLTEFFNPPTPSESIGPANQNGLQDTTLTFGAMQMTHGRAFLAGTTSFQNNLHPMPVYKSWTIVDGRTLLVEELPYQTISPQFTTLPAASSGLVSSANSILQKLSSKRLLPPARLATASTNTVHLAKADYPQKPGLVFDYVAIDSGETNFTFQGDTTYYLSGGSVFSGITIFEGGTVIKGANTSGSIITIDENGTTVCQTAPYRPAIFTSVNDDTIGEPIWDISSGTPNFEDNLYPFLAIDGTNAYLHDLRFSYGWQAISDNFSVINYTNFFTVRDCQFYDVVVPVYAYDEFLYNDLMGTSADEMSEITNQGAAQIYVEGSSLVAENVTADSGYAFIEDDDSSGMEADLTNCLITSEPMYSPSSGYIPTISTDAVIYLPSPSSPIYQVVGGGNYYLTNGSSYHNQGTTNIDPVLLKDLAEKTTYPPVVYDGTNLSFLGTLGPCVARDTNNSPDPGYHYDPLDYAVGGCILSNSLTFTTNTAVAWFEDNGQTYISGEPYGISLDNGANLSFNGSATEPCILTRSALVQEGGNGKWGNSGWNLGLVFMGSSQEATVSANFTKWTSTYFINILQDRASEGEGSFKNCEFYNNTVTTYNVQYLYYTNCLFFRPDMTLWSSPNLTMENCTVFNGEMEMDRSSPVTWLFENCSFDGTAFNGSDSYIGNTNYTTINYNAYNKGNLSWQTNQLYPPYNGTLDVTGVDDVMITNYNWETSWFGNFYLPTNSPIRQKGSTTANLVGLYHFTTQTNQIPNSTNVVDIGYHYVATDQFGNPLDTNGDGIPDYLEDANGDGLFDGNDLADWQISPYGLGGANSFEVFTPLKH